MTPEQADAMREIAAFGELQEALDEIERLRDWQRRAEQEMAMVRHAIFGHSECCKRIDALLAEAQRHE